MTVNAQTGVSPVAIGNGVATVFPFAFQIAADDEIIVLANGIEVLASKYSVNRAADWTGSVTFVVAPAVGVQIVLASDPTFDQQSVHLRQGPFYPDVVEDDLDRAAIRDIALQRRMAGAIRVAEGQTAPVLDATDLSDGDIVEYRAGTFRRRVFEPLKFLATDALGKIIAIAGLITGVPAIASNITLDGGGSVQAYINSQSFLWAEVSTVAVPASVNKIVIRDRGGMILKRVGADPGALWPAGYVKVQDATSAWWIYDTEANRSCAPHFGIVPELWGTYAGPDQAAKVQVWVRFVADIPHWQTPDMGTQCRVDSGIDMRPTTGEWKTRQLHGVMYLRGGAYVTNRYSIEINNLPNYFRWDGGVLHSALGSSAYAARQNWGGIVVGQCSRAYIAQLGSSYNISHGVKIVKTPGVENSNLLRIGRISGNLNGCGLDVPAYTNSVVVPNNVIQFGGATSTSQRTRLGGFTLAQLPHPAIDLHVADLGVSPASGLAQRTDSCFAWFPSQGLRKITHVDRVAGAISLFPAVTSAVVGETMRLIYGSPYSTDGADTNLINVDILEGAFNGTGADMNAFYNGVILQAHCDAVGVAWTGGSRNTAGTQGGVIAQAYVEVASYGDLAAMSPDYDLRILSQTSGSNYPVVANLLDPVDPATGNRARGEAGIGSCEITIKGVTYSNHRNIGRYGNFSTNAATLKLGGDNPETFQTTGASTLTLTPAMATFKDCVELLGVREVSIVVAGTGAGNAPGGPVTIPAIVGYKFNGGAVNTALVPPTPTKPTKFTFCLDDDAGGNNIRVMTSPYA